MTERAPPLETSEPRPRRHGAHGVRATEAELRDAVERAAGAAAAADGLALLEGAPLECVAVLLGLSARAVERVRAALEDPRTRETARELYARAAASRPPAAVERAPAAAPRDAGQLLAAATRRPGGLALLLGAAPECVAIVFGVHPDLVQAARELAGRRGLSQDLPPDA